MEKGEEGGFYGFSKGETVTNNEIIQRVRQAIITEHTESNLIGGEITFYGTTYKLTHESLINGSGYRVVKRRDGDFFYYKWQLTGLVTVPGETNWEVEMDRTIQFIGGTGKDLRIKGTGTCKEKAAPAGEVEKCEGEWEY